MVAPGSTSMPPKHGFGGGGGGAAGGTQVRPSEPEQEPQTRPQAPEEVASGDVYGSADDAGSGEETAAVNSTG